MLSCYYENHINDLSFKTVYDIIVKIKDITVVI